MSVHVQRATNVAEGIQLLNKFPDGTIISGGTDFIPRVNQGLETPKTLISIGDILELREIKNDEKDSNSIVIGSAVKLTELNEDPLLQGYTSLLQAACKVATPQIRNQGTIGGNILQENRCMYYNQSVSWRKVSPCYKLGGSQCYQYKKSPGCVALFQSDIAPVLMSYQATAILCGSEGQREIPVSNLYLNAGKKNKQHNEILTGIRIPKFDSSFKSVYARETIRGSFDFPIISCAVLIKVIDHIIEDVCIVLGSAGVYPREITEAKDLMKGKNVQSMQAFINDLKQIGRKHIAPFKDTRVNFKVRRLMGETVIERVVQEVCQKG